MKLAPAIAILTACSLACCKKPESGAPPAALEGGKPAATPDKPPAAATADAAAAPPATALPPAAAPVDAAAAVDDNPRTSELCGEVLLKIVDCAKDKQFLSALDEGVDAKRKAANKKHLAQIVKWHYTDCGALPTAIEDGGFLDSWSKVSGTPGVVDSCGKLGTALNLAGGLFGGDVAN